MKKAPLILLFCLLGVMAFAQDFPPNATSAKKKKVKPPIEWYKIVSMDRDTTYVDTTLSYKKEYAFNYLRRDNFELLPFSNVGQTYNTLAYTFDRFNLKPLFAAQSHHFFYKHARDINYYHVPTPLSDIYFKTAFEQGQQMDAFFTTNTSEQFNFSLSYQGVRSLGKYQNILTSTGSFRFTSNYHTKDQRYNIRVHMTAQDLLNEENGGLTETSKALFESNDSEFTDRGRLDVNFEDAENKLEGLRFFGIQEYQLIRRGDSTSYTRLTLGNKISYEDRFYEYRQDAPYDGFGPSYVTSDLKKTTKLEDFQIDARATLENDIIGRLGFTVGYTDYNYGYNSVLELEEGRITNRIKGDIVHVAASYNKRYKGFDLHAQGALNIAGDLDANYLKAGMGYQFDQDNSIAAQLSIHSVAPNFNLLLNQSDYVNYNWQTQFNNVKTQELGFVLRSKKIMDATLSYTGIDDYAYFAIKAQDSTPTPHQYNERVDYLKVKVEREFKFGKFGLMNTILFQQALSGEEVFNVPEIITRQTLYFEDHWFKRAMFMQTGINFKYFTSYNMNGYDPVLAEFYVQNQEELGGFPLLDIFFSAKVRQTRIFFKWEHFNQLFNSTNQHYSAPGYPYRDAVIRFGLVWNFFL